jgi:hypothetical protein
VTVDARGRSLVDVNGNITGWDVSTVLTNASSDPIYKTRLRFGCDDESWGPQLFGTLSPGHTIEVIARIWTTSEDLNAHVRFVDVEGRSWVAGAQGEVRPDDALQQWIEDGRRFAVRTLTPLQRGTAVRSDERTMPDFDVWAEQLGS